MVNNIQIIYRQVSILNDEVPKVSDDDCVCRDCVATVMQATKLTVLCHWNDARAPGGEKKQRQ